MIFRLTFISALIFNAEIVYSQNLTNNGSLEDVTECPMTIQDLIGLALFFSNPTTGTPDLFHICSSTVPFNGIGFQFPQDGDCYAGFYTYSNQIESTINVREYIQNKLLDTLSSCSTYEVSFYVNLADTFRYAINSIGAFVSSDSIRKNDFYCFDQYEPQVNNPKNRMLSDKVNWMKIEGKFVAKGNEQYITFGNFHLDNEIDTFSTTTNTWLSYMASYYYIDNVSLIKVADETTLAFAGNDTTIYVGDSTFIGQDIYNLNCTWSNLETGEILADSISGIWVSPTETTIYLCEQNLCGIITYDTIVVSTIYKNPAITSSGPINLCTGDSLVLSTNVTNGILWHPNEETSPTITITEQGNYYLSQTVNEFTTYSDTINVTFNTTPTPELSLLEPFCDTTSTFQLNNGLPSGGIYFVNGEQTTFFDASNFEPGDYELVYQLNNQNCEGFDTTFITVVACSVGLEEIENNNDIFVYPNPFKDKFIIKGKNIQEIKLFDFVGREIDITLFKIDDYSFMLSNLKNEGIYNCFIETTNETKVIKIQSIK